MADVVDRDILWSAVLRRTRVAYKLLGENLRVCTICDELVRLSAPTISKPDNAPEIGHDESCRAVVVWGLIENVNAEPALNSRVYWNAMLRPWRTVYRGIKDTTKTCVACRATVSVGDPEHVRAPGEVRGHRPTCWTLDVYPLLTGTTPPPGGGTPSSCSADSTLIFADSTVFTADCLVGGSSITADNTSTRADSTAITADAT